MTAFTRVLCPVDFSDTSDRALAAAAAVATWYDAALEVLHVVPAFDIAVVEPPVASGGPPGRPAPASRDEIVAALQRAVDRAGAAGRAPRLLAQEGRAHELIVHRAAAWPADLIVLGTHGRSGFSRLLLGSITEKVIRTAPCPVLTVPPAAPAGAAHVMFKRVLCPIDYSPVSLRALRFALELGRQADGRVAVLHALEYIDPQTREYVETEAADVDVAVGHQVRQLVAAARERLRAHLAGESQTWPAIDAVVVVNRPYRAVLQYAARESVDLIVMGAQGSDGLGLMLFGSNTHHVVRMAACPVLTVRA